MSKKGVQPFRTRVGRSARQPCSVLIYAYNNPKYAFLMKYKSLYITLYIGFYSKHVEKQ